MEELLLGQSPYPPLQLSFEEQQHCHDLSLQLLERTLLSYDERLAGITPQHHANLDSARWKLERTQDNASLYSERIRRVRTDLHIPGDDWDDPSVLMLAGTIPASLDEVMLGMVTPNIDALRIRMSTLGNHEAYGTMLAKLVGPTDEKPFQHLNVVHLVARFAWIVNKVIRPRDLLVLSTSGIITTADGERIGYELMQPAPLPQCPPLPKPMIRGKFIIGCLYRELEDGSVDVYMQQYVEPLGNMFNSFVVSHTWQALLGLMDAPLLAEHKKLQWCIANTNRARRRGLASELLGYSVNCSLCSVAFSRAIHSRYRDQRRCVICLAPVCSSCREERVFKVLEQQPKKKVSSIKKRRVHVCLPCLEFVQQHKATDVVRYNVTNQLTPASNSTGDNSDIEKNTWGLLDSDSMPSWSPSRSLSMSSEPFELFNWKLDRHLNDE